MGFSKWVYKVCGSQVVHSEGLLSSSHSEIRSHTVCIQEAQTLQAAALYLIYSCCTNFAAPIRLQNEQKNAIRTSGQIWHGFEWKCKGCNRRLWKL